MKKKFQVDLGKLDNELITKIVLQIQASKEREAKEKMEKGA